MRSVRCESVMRFNKPISSEQVTDLIETMVDALDGLNVNPCVSATGVGTEVLFVIAAEGEDADWSDDYALTKAVGRVISGGLMTFPD